MSGQVGPTLWGRAQEGPAGGQLGTRPGFCESPARSVGFSRQHGGCGPRKPQALRTSPRQGFVEKQGPELSPEG